MKFLLTLALSAAYLTVGPVVAVQTARSVDSILTAPQPDTDYRFNTSVHYKTDGTTWQG